MNTFASNPGDVRVNKWRLRWSEPFWSVFWIIAAIAFLGMSAFERSGLWVSLAGLSIGFFLGTGRSPDHFQKGDVNISKVLSLKPALFATSTNMRNTFSDNEYPVVKIVRRRVPGYRGNTWKVGDYFPAACMYSGSLKKDHWKNFFPLPLTMATDSVETIVGHLEGLEHLRSELDLRLSLVPRPYKPGLYFLDQKKLEALRGRSEIP